MSINKNMHCYEISDLFCIIIVIKCLIFLLCIKKGLKVREWKIRCTKVSWRLPERPVRNNCWYKCVPLRRPSWLQTRRWAPRSSLGKCHEAKQPSLCLQPTEKKLSYKMQWIALTLLRFSIAVNKYIVIVIKVYTWW